MSATELIKQEYLRCCQSLGDLTYQRCQIDRQIEEIKSKMESLNLLNMQAAAQQKAVSQPSPIDQFRSARERETGARVEISQDTKLVP